MEYSSQVLSHRFSAARASVTFVDPEMEQKLRILHKVPLLFSFYTKRLSFILILHNASQLCFDFTQSFSALLFTIFILFSHPRRNIRIQSRVVAMVTVASNNTHALIKNCPVFAGRSKDTFHEYKSKLRVCLSYYSKPVFEVFQGQAQPSSTTPGSTDTATLNAVAEQK